MNSSLSNVFSPALLKAGDNSQRSNWAKGKGSSIFVQSIPDELDETIVRDYFRPLGTISNIEFENSPSGKCRRMFIHFSEWSSDPMPTVQKIADAYPQPHEITVRIQQCFENGKYNGPTYNMILCYIDTRPKPVDKDAEIAYLKAQIELLQNEVKKMNIEVLQWNEMIDELLKDNSKYGQELQELKDKSELTDWYMRRPISYGSCPNYDEDIAVEEEHCFSGFPPDKRDKDGIVEWFRSEEERIEHQNDTARRHGISERHLR